MLTKLPVFTFLFIFSFYSGFGQAFYSASPNTLHFMTGAIPNSLTISSTVKADFNNDGRPDLAIIVANSDTARVRIFSSNCFPDLNQKIDSFIIAYCDIAYNILNKDLNNDGWEDIVVLGEDVITTYIQSPGGGFTFTSAIFSSQDYVGKGLLLNDFDRDNIADLLVSHRDTTLSYSQLYFYKGNGNGTFQSSVLTGAQSTFEIMYDEDVNFDGLPDLITCEPGSVMRIYLNDAAQFNSYYELSNMPAFPITAMRFYHESGKLLKWAGSTLNGTFYVGEVDTVSGATTYSTIGMGALSTFCFGEFNGDSIVDLALSTVNSPYLQFLIGTGTGYTLTSASNSVFTTGNYSLFAEDITGDNRDELFFTRAGAYGLVINKPNLTFTYNNPIITPDRPKDVAAADFNGDGLVDVASLNYHDGTVTVFFQECGTKFSPGSVTSVINSFNSIVTMTIFDFDHDSLADLVVADAATDIHILHGNGDGTFTEVALYNLTHFAKDIIAADVNNDGWEDLIASQYNNVISVWQNHAGVFSAIDYSLGSVQQFPEYIHYEDYNGDGFKDIGAGLVNCPEDAAIIYGDGTGNFANVKLYSLFQGFATYSIEPLDYNHDTYMDLAAISMVDNVFSLRRGFSNNNYFNFNNYDIGITGPSDLIGGDFNGDGFRDFFISSYIDSKMYIFGQKPDGKVYGMGSGSTGQGPRQSVINDLNNDNKPDFITANEDGDNLSIYINDIPRPPTVSFLNDTIFAVCDSNYVAVNYEWYFGDSLIYGYNNSYFPSPAAGVYWATITVQNYGFSSSMIDMIQVGIQEISLKEFSIYPNPARESMNVSFQGPPTDLLISNIYGQSVIEFQAIENKQNIRLDNLASGIYFINASGFKPTRFIKL